MQGFETCSPASSTIRGPFGKWKLVREGDIRKVLARSIEVWNIIQHPSALSRRFWSSETASQDYGVCAGYSAARGRHVCRARSIEMDAKCVDLTLGPAILVERDGVSGLWRVRWLECGERPTCVSRSRARPLWSNTTAGS